MIYLWSPVAQHVWHSAAILEVDGTPSSSLKWSDLLVQIEQAQAPLIFHLNLGLESMVFRPEDTAPLQRLFLVLDHFCKEVLSTCVAKTLAVRLYQGSLDLSSLFPSQWWQEVEGVPMQLFADYLKRLASALPDTVIPYVTFDAANRRAGALLKELSLERFSPLVVCVTGQKLLGLYESSEEIKEALLLPEESLYDAACEESIDGILEKTTHPFRLVNALKLNEEWGGLEEIVIPTTTCISHRAQRQLNGFKAAGGQISFEKTNRSRGI